MPINKETIISVFNEKMTLLQWLKLVEGALNDATLQEIEWVYTDETHVKLRLLFLDGTTQDTNAIELIEGPQGEQGPQGPQGNAGVSVTNVSVNASNHLIVTLSNGQTIDAGEISTSGGGTQLFKHNVSCETLSYDNDAITWGGTTIISTSPTPVTTANEFSSLLSGALHVSGVIEDNNGAIVLIAYTTFQGMTYATCSGTGVVKTIAPIMSLSGTITDNVTTL